MEVGHTNDTISVIVPVYNSASRLDRCVESLASQTYDNLQIILVNDGSRDNSGSICDAWAEKDNRIVVIHKSNGGVGKARNTGLDAAHGKYVAFIDSDDYLSANMFQSLITTANACQADQVCCNAYDVLLSGIRPTMHAFANAVVQKGDIFNQLIVSLIRPEMEGSKASLLQALWNKLYLRKTIEDNHIRFDTELTYAEDWLFNVNFYRFANCVAFIPDHLYFYDRTTEGSLSKKFRWDGFEQSVKIRQYERTWFPQSRTDSEYYNLLLSIQTHYLSSYVNARGYAGFGKYARYLFENEKLQNIFCSAQTVPIKYKVPQFCIKHTGSSFYRSMYQSWAAVHVCISAAKYYVKKLLMRS